MADRVNEAKWIESREHWRIDVQKDGVRKSFYSPKPGRKGKAECNRKADAWLDTGIENADTRLKDLFAKWIEHQKTTTSESAWSQYEGYVNRYFLPKLKYVKIGKLSEQDFQDILDELAFDGKAQKTIKNVRGAASSFCKWCRKHKYTQIRCDDLTIPPIAKKAEKKVLTVSDYQTVMTEENTTYKGKIVKDWYIYAYRFALVTGVRPGELIGLQWSNVDFAESCVNIKGAINDHNQHTMGKNENARRSIPLGSIGVKILQDQRKMLSSAGMLSTYVFPNRTGDFVPQIVLRNAWHRYQDYNQMSRLTLYEIRHTFVSANKDLPEGMVRDVVGHSKDMDTFGTYGHVFHDEGRETAIRIDANVNKILEYKRPNQ